MRQAGIRAGRPANGPGALQRQNSRCFKSMGVPRGALDAFSGPAPVRSRRFGGRLAINVVEIGMGKRMVRRATGNVHAFPDSEGWDPLGTSFGVGQGGLRDQSYVRKVRPQGDNQRRLMAAMDSANVVLAIGPAGTGKTYLAIAKAVEALEAGKVGPIVLSRPAVEAGQAMGFLPGAMEDQLAPDLR